VNGCGREKVSSSKMKLRPGYHNPFESTKAIFALHQFVARRRNDGIHPATPDLDGGGSGAQVWWEAPCAETKYLGRG